MSESLFKGFESFESYGSEYEKQQTLDFFSFNSPPDILAPHPDLFELELDHSLAAFDEVQLQLLTVDTNDAYSFLRSDTPTCGPPSTITVSSASSAYDSHYNSSSSYHSTSNYSFPIDLDMDFQRISVENMSDYSVAPSLPATPPMLNPVESYEPLPKSSFSDYGPSRSTEFYDFDTAALAKAQSTVIPAHISPPVAARPAKSPPAMAVDSNYTGDLKKRYRCEVCPRAFARAYNLKTHMATHDPNRLKPHVCPYRGCNRSFSRKHDLGRHLVSIHRDGSESSLSDHSVSSKKAIGVTSGSRSWCNSCGRGWIALPGGESNECDCKDS